MLDPITLKRIETLHPKIRESVRTGYAYANEKMLGRGVRLRLAYTTRSFKEQDQLYAQGRTMMFDGRGNRLGKVTNAKGGQSYHNYGLAFDIVLLLDRDGDGTFEAASWDTKKDFDGDGVSDWMEVVKVFEDLGFEWGGSWAKFKDYPHFQMTFGYTTAQLLEKYNNDFFVEEIDGVMYKYVKL